MITLADTTFLTVEECLDRLRAIPLTMSERTFRQRIRASGSYIEHRGQLLLTEADLAAVLDSLRPGDAGHLRCGHE